MDGRSWNECVGFYILIDLRIILHYTWGKSIQCMVCKIKWFLLFKNRKTKYRTAKSPLTFQLRHSAFNSIRIVISGKAHTIIIFCQMFIAALGPLAQPKCQKVQSS